MKSIVQILQIKDAYNWLEDPEAEETKAFVDAQNSISIPFIHSCPKREAIHSRLKQLWDYPKYSCPVQKGEKFYFFHNTGLQNQRFVLLQHVSMVKKFKNQILIF